MHNSPSGLRWQSCSAQTQRRPQPGRPARTPGRPAPTGGAAGQPRTRPPPAASPEPRCAPRSLPAPSPCGGAQPVPHRWGQLPVPGPGPGGPALTAGPAVPPPPRYGEPRGPWRAGGRVAGRRAEAPGRAAAWARRSPGLSWGCSGPLGASRPGRRPPAAPRPRGRRSPSVRRREGPARGSPGGAVGVGERLCLLRALPIKAVLPKRDRVIPKFPAERQVHSHLHSSSNQ